MLSERIRATVREVPDFPSPGINFKDITPILEDPSLCAGIIDGFVDAFRDDRLDAIAGIESRGFLFGMLLAQRMNLPFVTIRKKGKLPWETVSYKYDLEYGSAEMEMHVDSVRPGWNVLIHDDLLATGGTASAAAELIRQQGGNIGGFAFVIELSFLNGLQRLQQYGDKVVNLVTY